MFDTNIFNRICDGEISLSLVDGVHQYLVTHIQRDELEATRNEKRRRELLEIFEAVNQVLIPTESAVLNISRYNLSKFSDGLEYGRILQSLEKEKPNHDGNKKDALIGETAIKNRITLVSDDRGLRESVKELGGVAISLCDFVKETNYKG
jgi:predicted nucleic acid-binding protein